MANPIIIPPEFYGFFGLGQSLQEFGQGREQRRQQKQQAERQENQDALVRIQTLQRLYPNNPEVWINEAVKAGLVPEGVERTPTADEQIQQLLSSATSKIEAGVPYEELDTFEQLALGTQFGLRPGQTPDTAQQLEALEIQRRGLEVQAADRANTYAEAFDAYLAVPEVRERFKLPEGANRGSIEALSTLTNLSSQQLTDALTRARTDTERAQLGLIRAQIKKYEREAEEIAKESPDAVWLLDLSKAVGYSPLALRSAFDPESEMTEEHRNLILGAVQTYRDSILADFQKKINAGEGGNAAAILRDMVSFRKAGITFGIADDDPFWQQLAADALTEMGVPAHVAQMPSSWLRNDPRFGLQFGEALTEPLPTGAEQAAELVGESTEFPTISEDEASVYAARLVARHGSIEAAVKAVEESGALPADIAVLKKALQETSQTTTPAPVETPEMEPVGEPRTPPSIDDERRQALIAQVKEQAQIEHAGHYQSFGNYASLVPTLMKLDARRKKLESLQKELQRATDKEIGASTEDARAVWRRVGSRTQDEINKIQEEIRELNAKIDEKLVEIGVLQ